MPLQSLGKIISALWMFVSLRKLLQDFIFKRPKKSANRQTGRGSLDSMKIAGRTQL